MKKWLLSAIFSGTALLLFSESYVAEPERAQTVKWNKFPKKGHDFWLLLKPSWHRLKGVSDEEFVKNSGTVTPMSCHHSTDNLRILSLNAVECMDISGKKVLPEISVSADPEVLVLNPENLTDGNDRTYCVITGPINHVKTRAKAMKSELKIKTPVPIKSLIIRHGFQGKGEIASFRILPGNSGKMEKKGNQLIVQLKQQSKELTLELCSSQELYSPRPFSEKISAQMKKAPVVIHPPVRFALGTLLGLEKSNIDQEGLRRLEKEYRDTFVGYQLDEWDSNFFQTLRRPTSRRFQDLVHYIQVPCDRDGMLQNLQKFWSIHRNLFGPDIYVLSGMVNFEHISLDLGGKIAALEITSEHIDHQHRNNYVFLRGAARQFEKPMLMYFAYYARNYTAASDRSGGKSTIFGLDFGVPPSLGLRNFYMTYYMGGNYLDFECQPMGQANREKDGTFSLTANGKAMKDIYEWSRNAKGRRGESYAPILLLADRLHGYDGWHRLSPYWSSWYDLYPLREGDLLLEYLMQAMNPNDGYVKYGEPGFIGNLRNSTLGDIFDLYLANPPVSGEVRLEQLEKYPVVILANQISWTEKLVNRCRQYVADGGTLVLTAGHIDPFIGDPGFLGAKPESEVVRQDDLTVRKFSPEKGSTVLMRTAGGMPLVIKHPFHRGHVILITSPFFRKKVDPYKVPKQLVSILEKIQDEVVRVKVRGDCQFQYNIMPDGTWKVILINNKGIIKAPWESYERHDPKYTAEVKLLAPAGCRARELRRNAPIRTETVDGQTCFTLKIPPAEILVVDVTGIPKAEEKKTPQTVIPPVKGFSPRPKAKGKPNDGYKAVPKQESSVPAPEIIGKWTAASGYRDAVGGHDLKLTGFRGGKPEWTGKGNACATVKFPVKYQLPEGSWTIWAKPLDFKDFPEIRPKLKRGGIIYTRNLMLEYCNGRWVITGINGPQIVRQTGSVAKPNWTLLAVTWKNGIVRLFADGRESPNPLGPVKLQQEIGVNSFYKHIDFTLGSLDSSWARTFPFAGELGDFTWYSRALTEEEISVLARSAPGGRHD